MKSMEELNPHNYSTTDIIHKNLVILYQRLSELQDCIGVDFTITSGLRSDAHQQALIAEGKSTAKFSKHLIGAAADLYDPEKKLAKWCMANLETLASIGIWLEHPDYTKNWLHCQVVAPKSGNRVFIP